MSVQVQFSLWVKQLGAIVVLCLMAPFAMADKKAAEAVSAPEKPVKAESAKKPSSAAQITPHQVVDDVTNRLMKIVDDNAESIKTEPEKYYTQVRVIMEEAVDFKYIAKNVMGKDYWKAATDEQRKRFIEVFTTGLVETYAKGMANFAEFEISVVPPTEKSGSSRKATVIQKFKGPNGVNKVAYSMGRQRSGSWKLLNVVLDGVNLGITLQKQFSQSVKESKGDLNKAINDWKLSS